MASRNEQLLYSLGGAFLFGLCAYHLRKHQHLSPSERLKKAILPALAGAASGLLVAELVGTKRDTVVYKLYRKTVNGKPVYVGLTYANRLDMRMKEHLKNGKVFKNVTRSRPLTRKEAFLRERKLIKEIRPSLNIIHNK